MTGADLYAITAIILAGGQARRFGGQDKGLIELAGRPLAAWVSNRLAGQVDEILISANRNSAKYETQGHSVIADLEPDYPGPLAGLLAAGHAAQHEWLLTVPCDVPFLPLHLAERLLAQARSAQVQLVQAADETGTHFAVMLVRRDLLPDLETYLQGGGRQVQAWQARHPNATVCFAGEADAFHNINTPDDLELAERIVAKSRETP